MISYVIDRLLYERLLCLSVGRNPWYNFRRGVACSSPIALGCDHAQVVFAALVEYEDFAWYKASQPGSFGYLCWSSGENRGGRCELFPVLQHNLAKNGTVARRYLLPNPLKL